MPTVTGVRFRPNRLTREKSPYLLQHQFNPVDWYAWGLEAFDQARSSGKPIFLSIGYSTCHWCHVMERESFENTAVAGFLNQNFISIKVDREERPDVDRVYMTFVQATTGQGGWPLTVFLTPELKPFFGGTYFPPDSRYGRPGFLQLLQQIHQVWHSRRNDVADSAAQMTERLAEAAAGERSTAAGAELGPDVLKAVAGLLKQSFDPRHGGFGQAPKFPQPSLPQLLLRCALRFNDEEARRMVLLTCDHMATGGIHDQLGGGFARYSVDAEWLVPHFEKMLYDNAQLAQLYLDAGLVSGESRYFDVARDILNYVLRDMTHPEGGFYSAEDADSEGHEGKFYCWTRQELRELLAPQEFDTAVRYFGITEQGNFVDHSHPQPLSGQNVLSVVDSNLSGADHVLVAAAKRKMFAARSSRVRPHLDDKVLASWNGLMLGAMARASAVLREKAYRAAAEKNLAFMRNHLWEPASAPGAKPGRQSGTLYHRWREGERDETQLLAAYAFLLSGVLELYDATAEPAHLEFAVELATAMLARFYDAEHGGFWQAAAVPDLILRLKDDHDGAEPSGNSVAVLALLKLAALTGRAEFRAAAEKTLHLFSARLREAPQALPYLLSALDFSLQEPLRAVVAGDPAAPKTRELLHALHSVYQPNMIILGTAGPVEPFARTLPQPTAPLVYLCAGTACQEPTAQVEQIRNLLSASRV